MDQCGHNAANQVADECKFLTRALNLRLYAICTDFWPSPIHNTTFCSRATGSQKNRKTNLYQKKTGHTTYEIAFRYLQRIHFFWHGGYRNYLQYVGWGVKLYSLTHSVWLQTFRAGASTKNELPSLFITVMIIKVVTTLSSRGLC